ncbi:virulence factor Mce-like protein [Nocardia transvalensis]|uniref:Virulence factor Mce-like protein n=1 Tax=Nocardia transvalensis TaxID=37333 RepID=A0A7W9PH63_9NOCA|nr:MCE family protein [Nocardia transvalensis]MBB5915987.1 virulence factor Mce-like protein [Nocardia transvalensis]
MKAIFGTRHRSPRRRLLGVTATVAVAVTAWSATGCSVSLDKLPLPAPGVEGYAVTATFANALNLPTMARVRFNGADIGQVESMRAENYTAVVSMRIASGVQLPAGTTAELRSATPMGDVFVALTPPAHPDPGAPDLGDGANIPLPQTSAAATIEEVLTKASLLVNGGAIENVTSLANNLGQAVGGRGDRLGALIEQTRDLVNNLAARSDRIRAILAGAADLSATAAAQRGDLSDAVAAAAPASQVIGDNTQQLVDLIGQVNRIARQLDRYPSVNGTSDRSLVDSMNRLADGLNVAANNPEADLDALNSIIPIILKVTDASSAHVDVDVVRLAAGAVPDPNTPADSGGRMPDATDWASFIGSLRYTLDRLKNKVEPVR